MLHFRAKDAKRYLDKYKRLDAALDAYFNDPVSRRGGGSATAASTSKLNALFDKYKGASWTDLRRSR